MLFLKEIVVHFENVLSLSAISRNEVFIPTLVRHVRTDSIKTIE